MDGERGTAVTEAVVLTPLVVLLMAFVAFCGRLASTAVDVESAASDAARAASIATSAGQAVVSGEAVATAVLAERDVSCAELSVAVDPGALRNGDDVFVIVTCTVSLADLSGLGLPGNKTVRASAVEVVDKYRGVP